MSETQNRRRRKRKGGGQGQGQGQGGQGGQPSGGGGGGGQRGQGGQQGGKSGQARQQGRQGQQQPKKQAPAEPPRPFWHGAGDEAALAALTRAIRPVEDPTALVRSLGPPPLGKFADNAQHYYAAVYDKAQHFAIALATASGVEVVEAGSEGDGPADEAADADR